jgi:hypothetical protein
MSRKQIWTVVALVMVLAWSVVMTALGQVTALATLVPSLGLLVQQIAQAVLGVTPAPGTAAAPAPAPPSDPAAASAHTPSMPTAPSPAHVPQPLPALIPAAVAVGEAAVSEEGLR